MKKRKIFENFERGGNINVRSYEPRKLDIRDKSV